MKPNLTPLLAALLLAPLLVGCSSEQEQREDAIQDAAERMEEAAEEGNMGEAMEAFGEAMEGMASGEGRADPVDFRVLKEMLPEEAGGLRRASHSGERGGAMGMVVSQAEADYEGDDGATVDVKIVDLGGVPQIAMMGYGWAMAEVDRESDDGFERTMEYRGHRGYEQYDSSSNRAEMNLLVAGRFMVEAQGRNVDMDRLRAVVDDVAIDDLEDMRDEGR